MSRLSNFRRKTTKLTLNQFGYGLSFGTVPLKGNKNNMGKDLNLKNNETKSIVLICELFKN